MEDFCFKIILFVNNIILKKNISFETFKLIFLTYVFKYIYGTHASKRHMHFKIQNQNW